MVVGGEMHQAGLWSQRALERLAQDGLAPIPQNYAVYYHYSSGGMSALNAAFDAVVAQGKMTQKQCDDLYGRYIVADGGFSFIKDANSVIDREVRKVMDLLHQSLEGNGQFGEQLSTFSGQLADASTIAGVSSIEVLRTAVGKIADETRAVAEQNNKLQNELAATTDQLSEMRDNFDRVYRESQVDPLTEVGNRKFFDHEVVRAMTEAKEKNTILSMLMVDIDHFKKFNDTYGHLIGDQVLRLVARTMIENLKGRDIIARYGGEEFVILLPQTCVQDAERVANQLRASLATKRIKKRGSNEILGIITVSLGAAEYKPGEDVESLVGRADAALYKAKQTGRNKVVCADSPAT